jgi:hypothetical protein
MGLLGDDILAVRKYKYQKVFNFECILPIVGIADPIKVSRLVQSVNYIDYEMSDVEGMKYGAFQSFFSGQFKKRPFTISFIETEDQDVKRYLNAWRELMVDRHGLYKKKKGFLFGYAKPIFLNYLNNSGDTVNVTRFKYCFPISFSPWRLDYNESGLQKIEATFVCDKIEEIRDLISNPIEDFVQSKVPEPFNPR